VYATARDALPGHAALGVDAGMTVLDVGAGGGWFTRVLSGATGRAAR